MQRRIEGAARHQERVLKTCADSLITGYMIDKTALKHSQNTNYTLTETVFLHAENIEGSISTEEPATTGLC